MMGVMLVRCVDVCLCVCVVCMYACMCCVYVCVVCHACVCVGMRNLKLKMSVCSAELQAPGSPQCFSVRMDSGSLLIASPFSIMEYDPRNAQVTHTITTGNTHHHHR